MKKLLAVCCIASSMYAGQAMACSKPEAPALPDVSTAVTAEMVKAKNQVQSYMGAAEAYLECLSKDNVVDHNAMVESMEKLASEFNAMIRDFKARVKA